MASIRITVSLGAEIVSSNPQIGSGFGKYLRATPQRCSPARRVSQLRTPLRIANAGESGLRWPGPASFPLGATRPRCRWTRARARPSGSTTAPAWCSRRHVPRPAGESPVPAGATSGLPSVPAWQSGSSTGPARCRSDSRRARGGAAMPSPVRSHRGHRRHADPRRGDQRALAIISSFPNTADDLKQMNDLPEGTLACSPDRALQVGASVNLAAAFNPLASVDAIPRVGRLEVPAGASAVVGVKAALFGISRPRAEVDGPLVRLSGPRSPPRALDVSWMQRRVRASRSATAILSHCCSGTGGLPGASREDLGQGASRRRSWIA